MNSRAFSGREKKGSKLELPTRQMLNLAPGFCCSLILPLLSRWEQHTCQVDPGGGNFSRNGRRPVSWVADSPAIEPFRGSLPKVCRPHLTIDACYLNSANTQRTLKTHSVHPFQLLEYDRWERLIWYSRVIGPPCIRETPLGRMYLCSPTPPSTDALSSS